MNDHPGKARPHEKSAVTHVQQAQKAPSHINRRACGVTPVSLLSVISGVVIKDNEIIYVVQGDDFTLNMHVVQGV